MILSKLLAACCFALPLLAQVPTVTSVVNGGTFDSRLCPGVLASVFGSNLGSGSGTTVAVGGKQAVVVFTSATQVNVVIPPDLSVGATALIVTVQGNSSAPFSITLAAYAPTLFSVNNIGSGAGAFLDLRNQPVSASNPAHPGDIVSAYGTGFGQGATVTIGRILVTPSYAGPAPGIRGGSQVNMMIPAGVEGDVPVVLSIGGFNSNTVTITLVPVAALPVVAPSSLSFTAVAAGDAPPPQSINISLAGMQLAFTLQIDGGITGSPAPTWLSATPVSGTTPSGITVVVDQSGLSAGKYAARIGVLLTGETPIEVPVSLTVVNAPAKLDIAPDILSFAAAAQSAGVLERVFIVRNAGSGTLNFTAAITSFSPWLTGVTPASGQAAPNAPAFVRVHINSQGLATGSYLGRIHVGSPAGDVDLPVTLFVASSGPILAVDLSAVRFEAREGSGSSEIKTITVLNTGEPGSTVNWTVDVMNGPQFLTVGATSGTSTPSKPGTFMLSTNSDAAALEAGGHHRLVRVSDSDALNSPQYVAVVLDVAAAGSPPKPSLTPAGLLYITTAGSSAAARVVTVNTSSTSPVAFQVSTRTVRGGNWLQVSPLSGTSATSTPAIVSIVANATQLSPGIHTGFVDISMGGMLRAVNVTLIVLPAAAHAAAPRSAPGGPVAVNCTPSQLAIAQTGLVNNFAVPAAYPATLIISLIDDCGNPIPNGSVVARFSNGDPPLSLQPVGQSGDYSATWQPGGIGDPLTVTIRASAGTFPPATSQLIGGVSANSGPAPVLFRHGVVHNENPTPGGALAPGTVAQVYGSNLATFTGSPGVLPLALEFSGTQVLIGGYLAPLYYLSGGQLDVQIPSELTPGRQYAIVISVNGAITIPDTIDVNAVQPGIVTYADGTVVAQRPDYSLVDSNHPAKPGDVLTIYLAGMGATNPAVASGKPAPAAEPFARVSTAVTMTIDGNQVDQADIPFAALTPGAVGLYQINFGVPDQARSGNLDLIVIQSGAASNVAKLPVSR